MPIQVLGYAAQSESTPVGPFEFERRDLRATDVEIQILFCGICHTDLHQVRNEWGGSKYPMVPGHEIVGKVSRVGADITKWQVGDMVGVGCLVDSCQTCSACKAGDEQYCENHATFTYNDVDRHDGMVTYGGYSQRIIVTENFVVRIPAKLAPNLAAPLLCAGITTYSPLKHWKVGPGDKVAVVGLGGLGHMALKFAHAMGAEVTLFTRTPGKEVEARRLGAAHVVISTDDSQMEAVANTFDVIVDTVPNLHDFNPYLATLARDGKYVVVGQLMPIDPPLNVAMLIMGRKSFAGSLIGGIAETQEMMDFCAEHDVTCDIEMIKIQDIEAAYERMLKSDVKYRFVIDIASLSN